MRGGGEGGRGDGDAGGEGRRGGEAAWQGGEKGSLCGGAGGCGWPCRGPGCAGGSGEKGKRSSWGVDAGVRVARAWCMWALLRGVKGEPTGLRGTARRGGGAAAAACVLGAVRGLEDERRPGRSDEVGAASGEEGGVASSSMMRGAGCEDVWCGRAWACVGREGIGTGLVLRGELA